jgi:hypothetical protein
MTIADYTEIGLIHLSNFHYYSLYGYSVETVALGQISQSQYNRQMIDYSYYNVFVHWVTSFLRFRHARHEQ